MPPCRFPLLVLAMPMLLGQAGVPALWSGETVVLPEMQGSIGGTVTDPVSGRPAAGVLVSLSRSAVAQTRTWPEPWVPEGRQEDEVVAHVRTDSQGRFLFRGLAPGPYLLRPRGVLQSGAEREVVLGDGEARGGIFLSAEVGAELGGMVTDPHGEPLADVEVLLVGRDLGDGRGSALDLASPVRARTDESGRFLLSLLPAGRIWIQALSRSYGYSLPVEVETRSGERAEDIHIEVPDERAMLGRRSHTDGWIGVRLAFAPDGPTIRGLIPGMTAESAGLLPGDVFVAVGGREARLMTPPEFSDRCRGPLGSTVEVRILRDGTERSLLVVRVALP